MKSDGLLLVGYVRILPAKGGCVSQESTTLNALSIPKVSSAHAVAHCA